MFSYLVYLRFLLPRIYFVSENINSLVKSVVEFRDHLCDVHELERFYGDRHLSTLLATLSRVAVDGTG
jgi:hypothetical protein